MYSFLAVQFASFSVFVVMNIVIVKLLHRNSTSNGTSINYMKLMNQDIYTFVYTYRRILALFRVLNLRILINSIPVI